MLRSHSGIREPLTLALIGTRHAVARIGVARFGRASALRSLVRTIALLLVAACVPLGGCARGPASRHDPNTLVVMELGDANTLNPLFSSNYYSFLYQNLIFDTLVGVGNDFTDVPDLATAWKATTDGRHWTVDLRRGVLWSDGTPFTSRDVVFTWKTQLNPDVGWPYRGSFDYITKVTALGPYRVRFDLKNSNALFVSQALGGWILPEHVLAKIPPKQMRQTDFGEHPIGTGAWTLTRWNHDEELIFDRNPHGWNGAPNIRRIVFRVVINDQARIDAMEEGSADVDDGMGANGYAVLQSDHAPLRLLHIPDLFVSFIFVNLTRPGLDDVAVRRAMMYGWDRARLASGLARGDADLATSITPKGLPRWYDPHVAPYPYDLARARRLLDAAGYRAGPDGVRVRGHVRLAYPVLLPGSGSASGQDFAAEFQADMRAIGIAISVHSIDYATFLDETEARRFDLAISGWGGVPDPDQESLLASDQFPPNGNNLMHYRSQRADNDLRVGLATLGYLKRKPYYDDLQRVIAQDVPILYYEYPYDRVALSRRVRLDFAHVLPGIYLFRDVAKWRLAG